MAKPKLDGEILCLFEAELLPVFFETNSDLRNTFDISYSKIT